MFRGTTYTTGLGTIKKTLLEKLQIPIPHIKIQQQIVERLHVLNKNNETLKNNINEFKKIIKYYVDCHIMNEKVVKKLGDVCDINPENLSKDKYNFINYVDIKSVQEGYIVNFTKLVKDYPSRAQRIIKKNDILLSTVRPNLRNYAYVENDIENGICSTGFCVIRSNELKIISKFVCYQIMSDKITNYLINNATGSQYPAVNSGIVSNIMIKIPSKEKQQDIVNYCDNISDMITKLKKQIQDNNTLMKQIMDSYMNTKEDKSIDESDNDALKLEKKRVKLIVKKKQKKDKMKHVAVT